MFYAFRNLTLTGVHITSFGPLVQEESHRGQSKVQYKAKAEGSNGSSDICSFTKHNLQPLSSDLIRNFLLSAKAQVKQEKKQVLFNTEFASHSPWLQTIPPPCAPPLF
jgi:hypothetical protein